MERAPWIEQPKEPKKKITRDFKYSKSGVDPYREVDKDNFLWEEFLEEIDNLGYTPWDQDAIEIWETKYQ